MYDVLWQLVPLIHNAFYLYPVAMNFTSFIPCSQSEVGEGTFVFKADDAGGISQVIDWRIKNVIQTTGSPCEGAGGADTSPPPPQVPGVCSVVDVVPNICSVLYDIEAISKWHFAMVIQLTYEVYCSNWMQQQKTCVVLNCGLSAITELTLPWRTVIANLQVYDICLQVYDICCRIHLVERTMILLYCYHTPCKWVHCANSNFIIIVLACSCVLLHATLSCPLCVEIADRRGRHTKQVESHIYHEEPRIDLSERNGSVSSSRSTRSLKHQMSDVSTSSGGKCEFLQAMFNARLRGRNMSWTFGAVDLPWCKCCLTWLINCFQSPFHASVNFDLWSCHLW